MTRIQQTFVLAMLGPVGCPSRLHETPVIVDPPAAAKAPEPWRALLTQAVDPQELGPFPVAELSLPGPAEAPTSIEGRVFDVDMGPVWVRPMQEPSWCESADFPAAPGACAVLREDQRGVRLDSWRLEHDSAGRPIVAGYVDEVEGDTEFHRCKYDGLGRVVEHLQQWTSAGQGWDVELERWGYDEHGGVVFFEKQFTSEMPAGRAKDPDVTLHVYETTYDDEGRPVRVLDFESYRPGDPTDYDPEQLAEDARLRLTSIDAFHWSNGNVARKDSYEGYGEEGGTAESYVWQGDFVLWAGLVYERRGPRNYAELYEASHQRRWEHHLEGDVETSTMIANEFVAERRRFLRFGGSRRPLTVEQQLPDGQGLVVVETWNWDSPDRVVVDLADGRIVHLLDCTGEPSVDSSIDPQRPPPLPIR